MTTHIGKIARLAKERRDEVCRRLEDGQTGKVILKWLNGLRDVKAVLRAQFGGRVVNLPNLTAWRQSGYVEWLELEGKRRSVRELAQEANELARAAGKRGLGNGLALVLALEMDGAVKALLKSETDPVKRWERVREIHREVSRLRRDDDRVKRTGLRELEVQGPKPRTQSRNQRVEEEPFFEDEREDYEGATKKDRPQERGKRSLRADEMGTDGLVTESQNGTSAGAEGEGVNQDELRQVKAGQEHPLRHKLTPEILKLLPRIVERLPSSNPGFEYVRIQDKHGFWFDEKPLGWDVAEWKSPDEKFLVEDEEEESRSPKSEGRGQETDGKNVRDEKDSKEVKDVKAAENPVAEKAAEPFLWPSSPYVPDPNPEVEAYNRWWRMNRNFEKFDYDELQRIYAELPRKMAEYNFRLMCEACAAFEGLEGAGI